jgi:hypothetical protein
MAKIGKDFCEILEFRVNKTRLFFPSYQFFNQENLILNAMILSEKLSTV